jgi:serine/threonine-protein kinase HipA
MQGKKVWFSQKELEEFGIKYCLLSKKEVSAIYQNCINALEETIQEIKSYIDKNPSFKTVGAKMIDSFLLSLQNKTIKEIPNELIRTWKNY